MAFGKWIDIAAVLLVLCSLGANHGAQSDASMVIHRVDINCKVTSRFARSLISMEIWNSLNASQEAVFDVDLPKTAFITNFSMTIDGVTTVGVVKKKAEADEQYSRAVSRGESAGLVQSIGRKMENFKISVNVGPMATAYFNLTYEELLKRHLGNYELHIKVKPRQLVENFQINVHIVEPQEITFVNPHGAFMTNELVDTVSISHTGNKAYIEFSPSLDQQRKCPACSDTLLDGDFVVKYEVKRETSAGNVQIVNGYFVHYFAPSSLTRLPKSVVFVIDHSGSMAGRKMEQTFEAFTKILEDLPEEDYVGILKFNHDVSEWKSNLVRADPDNIKSAKEFVAQITARGGTNINSALLAAAKMLENDRKNKVLPEISASIIIFLSDGDPTSGVTNLETIMKNVKAAINGAVTLYSLGFGSDVDYSFLEKMSLENGGLARRIYEDSDSALQLQNFYKEVAFPVLLDVSLQYLGLKVNDMTQYHFKHYYQGSEIVVAGHIENNDIDTLTAQVTAQGVSEQFSMKVETNTKEEEAIARDQYYIFGDFTERLWAYLTIEQLLSKLISAEGEEKANITEEALRLCLKYSFVTPLTSMVITTSDTDATKNVVANKPKEQADSTHSSSQVLHGAISPRSGVLQKSRMRIVLHEVDVVGRSIMKFTDLNIRRDFIRVGGGKRVIQTQQNTSDLVIPNHGVALITVPHIPEKIFLGVDESPDTWINLLHSTYHAITLNGKLAAGRNSFEKLGLVHKKKSVYMIITADVITVINNLQHLKTYSWELALQVMRFVKKEGEKLIISLDSGFRVIVLRGKNPDRLNVHVESKKKDLEFGVGLIGQLMEEDNVLVENDQITILGETYFIQRSAVCDFTSYGIKPRGPCISLTLKTMNAVSGMNSTVSGILDVPLDS
ncbi:inter-alpha-trypsin inhibitor heavy chain H3-like isoform X2 [Hyperolius riggenbachi]|uniref:inter-alpha-trypsin inhibitor heavy chain H3-like isoform X2 n=1 Tax=Hyperolius riggenbachi TaxID=752182 RepID=UPI0035A3677F